MDQPIEHHGVGGLDQEADLEFHALRLMGKGGYQLLTANCQKPCRLGCAHRDIQDICAVRNDGVQHVLDGIVPAVASVRDVVRTAASEDTMAVVDIRSILGDVADLVCRPYAGIGFHIEDVDQRGYFVGLLLM